MTWVDIKEIRCLGRMKSLKWFASLPTVALVNRDAYNIVLSSEVRKNNFAPVTQLICSATESRVGVPCLHRFLATLEFMFQDTGAW